MLMMINIVSVDVVPKYRIIKSRSQRVVYKSKKQELPQPPSVHRALQVRNHRATNQLVLSPNIWHKYGKRFDTKVPSDCRENFSPFSLPR